MGKVELNAEKIRLLMGKLIYDFYHLVPAQARNLAELRAH